MDYDPITATSWEDALAAKPWSEYREGEKVVGWQLRTKCPRCGVLDGDATTSSAIDLVFRRKTIRNLGATIERTIYVECECDHVHPGSPAGSIGCGQAASILFTLPTGRVQ